MPSSYPKFLSILFLFAVTLLVIPRQGRAAATTICPPAIISYLETYRAAFKPSESVWRSYPYSRLRLVFPSQGGSVTFGFTPEELSKSKLTYSMCSGWPEAAIVQGVEPTGLDSESPFRSPNCNESFCGDIPGHELQLYKSTPEPILLALPQFKWDIPEDLKKMEYYASSERLAASLWVHEIFHIFQMQGHFARNQEVENKIASGPTECLAKESWTIAFKTEIEVWKSVREHIEAPSPALLENVLTSLLARRSGDKSCWNMLGRQERIEGTAFYVETETLMRAGLMDRAAWLARVLPHPEKEMIPGQFVIWYDTGLLMCKLMDHLQPDGSWQKRVEEGASLDSVLIDLLNSEIGSSKPSLTSK